jgi:threonylcarbamoyladenosine tRNA methylthiotransferase CDKAL1
MSCGIVDDIEDILKQDQNEFTDLTENEINRSSNKSFILPKSLKKNKINETDDILNEHTRPDESMSNVPGVASIFVKTWGCTHNSSDGEYMAGQLAAYGYKLVGNLNTTIYVTIS